MADSGLDTPETIARRLKMAELLMDQAKPQPITHWTQGLAQMLNAGLGGYEYHKALEDEKKGQLAQNGARMSMLGLGTPAVSGVAGALSAPTGPAPDMVKPPGAPPVQFIDNGDNMPSPLDPPSGQDRDIGIRTMYGEDPGASAPGVAAVLRKRAINGMGGSNLTDVAKAPGQFEPWSNSAATARMNALSPNSPDYQRLGATLDAAYAPNANDPTNGATHFFAPQAQAALGRNVPAWAQGPSTTMGPHAFYGGQGGPSQPAQVAGPVPQPQGQPMPAQPAATAPAQPVPAADPQASTKAQIAKMLSDPNPYVRKQGAAFADAFIQKHMIKDSPKFHKLNDETLFEEGTGNTKAAGAGFRPLVDPAERVAHGIPAEDKRPYQLSGNKLVNPPAETRLTVDQRQESAFETKAGQLQAERLDKIVQEGMTAKNMISDMHALKDIGSRITTGKTAEITNALGPYAEALGVKIDGLGDTQAYDAIVQRLAPQMRVAGTGATSDFEMRSFLKSLPNLGKTPQGNEILNNTFNAIAEQKQAAADIAGKVLHKEITRTEGDKMLRELPDPLTLWKQNKGQLPTAADAPPAPPAAVIPDRAAIEAEMKRRGL